MHMDFKKCWKLLRSAASDWSDDNASRLAAALAYYTLLSIAPMIVLAVAIAGLVYGEDAARGQIASELSREVGPQAANALQAIIESAKTPSSGVIGTIVGVITLLVGASGVFSELQASLNQVWEVEPPPHGGLLAMIKERFFSFALVLGVAFLLMLSLLLSAIVAAIGHFIEGRMPGGDGLWSALNVAFSFATSAALFAVIFRVVPDVRLRVRDVWVGAMVTAVLFNVGKFALGLYLGHSSMASAYGASGSIIALVVWVYYSAQILLFGAEFTQAYARRNGVEIPLRRGAVRAPRRRSGGDERGSTPPRTSAQSETRHPAYPRA
jgi:membrane protein